MRPSFIRLFALLTVPVVVTACEGECIVGITNAFLGNYTSPIHAVLENIANQIVDTLVPRRAHSKPPLSYLYPILDSYRKQSYSSMETAIFPSYFHGKCQRDGLEPPGCPNPDCPVVCGTPGSLVHFYSKLRSIAFNETNHILESLATPGSGAYEQVEKAVLADVSRSTARTLRIYPRYIFRSLPDVASNSDIRTTADVLSVKRSEDIKAGLKRILGQIPSLLRKTCSGSGMGETNGFSACSWEVTMKKYILSFP